MYSLYAGTQGFVLTLRVYTSKSKADIRIFPLGTTVVLKCTASELPPQAQYQWTCPHGPCDNEYRKIYNNVIVLVVTNTTTTTTTTTTSRDRYRCGIGYGNGTTFGAMVNTPLGSQTLGKGECNVCFLSH